MYMSINEKIIARLRRLSREIKSDNRTVLFVKNECRSVDLACKTIERGGVLEATDLASLVHYSADMME